MNEYTANLPLVIFGAGGFGREVLQIVHDQNRASPMWDFQGFLVDPGYPAPEQVHGFPLLGEVTWLCDHLDVQVAIAVGSSAARRRIARTISSLGAIRFATLIHPQAWLGENVRFGKGVIICAGTQLTTDIRIDDHVIINLGCTVGHDDVIDSYVTLAPGAHLSGHVTLGEGVEVGTGAVLLPGVTVGDGTVIGAGACVTKGFAGDLTVIGSPARVMLHREPPWHEARDNYN